MKLKYLALSIAIVILVPVSGQQQLKHIKKMFVSPDGKLFFNKDLPIYFWISTSPDKKGEKLLLTSESTPQYANPMYFDTEGRNTLRSPSAVDTVTKQVIMPTIDIQYQVYADSKPPVSMPFLTNKAVKITSDINYIRDSLSVFIKAIDELSGTENIYVSLNKQNFEIYKKAIFLDDEKLYEIQYYSVDNTGNVEKVNTLKISIDKTSPVSSLHFEGTKFNDILSGNGAIDIRSSDTISGVKKIYFAIDDTIFKPYSSKIQTVRYAEGQHILKYYSEDLVGNKEATQSYSFFVDVSPPQVIEEIMGKTFVANGHEFSAGTSNLKISSFDNKAGVKDIFYSINNAAFEKYEKPVSLAHFKGNVIIKSYAVDNVGNASENRFSNNKRNTLSYVDLGEPWVGHKLLGPVFNTRDTTFINHKTLIELDAKDAESGIQKIEYQLDSNEIAQYSKPFVLQTEGSHRITMFGYDNTDNLTRQEFHVNVDTIGPQIFERFSATIVGYTEENGVNIPQYPNYVVLFLSATDVRSGYENLTFKLNNFPEQQYMRDIRGFDTMKKNIVKIKAIDKLGNITYKSIQFYIK